MPEKRLIRRRPMQAMRALARAEARFAGINRQFSNRTRQSGARLLGTAFQLARARQAVRERLLLDPKFNIENDARFNERLFDFLRSTKSRNPFSFAIIDLDFLKKLNSEKGYAIADSAIALLAEKLSRTAKSVRGFAGRFGGDEFKVLAPIKAQDLAFALNNSLTEMKKAGLSFSAGIASSNALIGVQGAVKAVNVLNKRANTALNKSKRFGRARVSIY